MYSNPNTIKFHYYMTSYISVRIYLLAKSGCALGDRKGIKEYSKVLLLSPVVLKDELESSENRQVLGFRAM